MMPPRAALGRLLRRSVGFPRSLQAIATSIRGPAPREHPLRRTGAPTVLQALSYSTEGRQPSSSRRPPSLVITEAFEGHADDSDGGGDDEDGSIDDDGDLDFGYDVEAQQQWGDDELESAAPDRGATTASTESSKDNERQAARRFRLAMDNKIEWMRGLAADGDFDTLLQAVGDAYEPLYATHEAFQGRPSCPLRRTNAQRTRFRPKSFDDRVTRITESEAMALCVTHQRPDLAMDIYDHRFHLGTELGSIDVPRPAADDDDDDDASTTVDFATNVRSFYSWAMGASSALGQHQRIFAIYEAALERGVLPTANMTVTYLNALIARRENATAEALYRHVEKDDRPTNVYFYRQMLFLAGRNGEPKLVREILDEMKIKGFKLRSEEYFNALCAWDSAYFNSRKPRDSTGEDGEEEQSTGATKHNLLASESYRHCARRLQAHAEHPEHFQALEKAAEDVLALFDEMIDLEGLTPHTDKFFPRVVAAAMALRDVERVNGLLELFEQVFEHAPTDPVLVRLVTHAKLIHGDLKGAFAFVRKTYADSLRGHRFGSFTSLLEYAAEQGTPSEIVELLQYVDRHRALTYVSVKTSRALLKRLIQRPTLSDEELWETIRRFWRLYPVSESSTWLEFLLDQAYVSGRWSLFAKAMKARDRKRVRLIPQRTAVRFCSAATKAANGQNAVLLLLPLIKFHEIPEAERFELCVDAIRSVHTSERRFDRRILQLYEQHVRKAHKPIPEDIQKIILDHY